MARDRYREDLTRQQIAGLSGDLSTSTAESALLARLSALEGYVGAVFGQEPFVLWTTGQPALAEALVLSSGGDISLDFISFPGFLAFNIKAGVIVGSQIANGEIGLAKLADIEPFVTLGRMTAGNGAVEELQTAHSNGVIAQRVFAQRL